MLRVRVGAESWNKDKEITISENFLLLSVWGDFYVGVQGVRGGGYGRTGLPA